MRIHRTLLGLAAVFSAMAAHEVSAQIDHRVNNRVRGMDGRALDRNPMLGSGGINAPVSGYTFDGGLRARSLITGNLTGLASFHGQTEVLQGNGFRGALPTADLSGFQARSVGLGQVYSRRALAPTSYLGTQETIPDLGFIQRGLNRPGSSLLISPLTQRPLATVQEARSTLLDIRDPSAAIVGVQPDLATYGTRQRPIASSTDLTTGSATMGGLAVQPSFAPFEFAADSSIFGSPGPATFPSPVSAQGITSEARRSIEAAMLSRTLDRPINTKGTLGSDDGERGGEFVAGEAPGETQLPGGRFEDPRSVGAGMTRRPALGRDVRAEERAIFATGSSRPLSATKGLSTGFDVDSPTGDVARPADLGADKFADIVSAVRAAQASGAPRLGFLAEAGAADDGSAAPESPMASPDLGGATAPVGQGRIESSARSRDASIRESATAVQWAGDLLDNPITSFVGRYRDRLNEYMKQAEDALHDGKFYDAARLFELAHTIDPSNPLPLLGRGHALIAAGDYMSGCVALEQGLGRFPQMVAFRLDLTALVGQPDTYDLRRLDLEKTLESQDHYRLRFILGYLELYSGLQEQGLRDLRRAAELAPQESVIAVFPDLILGRQALPPVGRPLP